MNLYLCLLKTVLLSFFRSKIHPLEESEITFRVMPTDIDLMGHMNNGRYLQICDVARIDFMLRSGVLKLILAEKWNILLGGTLIHFNRSLHLWQKYRVTTKVVSWDERWIFMQHRFIDCKTGKEICSCLTRAAVRRKRAWVFTRVLIDKLMPGSQRPPYPESVKMWLAADDTLTERRYFKPVYRSTPDSVASERGVELT